MNAILLDSGVNQLIIVLACKVSYMKKIKDSKMIPSPTLVIISPLENHSSLDRGLD